LRQSETAEQNEPAQPSAPVEQAVASVQPPAPAVQLPEPPVSVQVTPVVVYIPLPQQLVLPPVAEPETRRPLLGRLLPGLFGRETDDAKALILAPAISKEATDRQNAAADRAKAANDAARQKANTVTRAREGAFFNSTLGVNAPY
jgi:hypothetical protein